MKKNNYLVAAGVLFSLSISIQAASGKKSKNLMFMDKDRNGVISFSEFSTRTEKMFSFLDQNSDGNITRQEMDRDENLKKQKMLSRRRNFGHFRTVFRFKSFNESTIFSVTDIWQSGLGGAKRTRSSADTIAENAPKVRQISTSECCALRAPFFDGLFRGKVFVLESGRSAPNALSTVPKIQVLGNVPNLINIHM